METTLTVNPFLHIAHVTPKWVYDEDTSVNDLDESLQDEAQDWTAYGCRMRAEILVEGVAGPQSYFNTFTIETSLWGIWEPDKAYREDVERQLADDLKMLLETRLAVDCSQFEERFKVDHFGKPVQTPKGSAF